VSLARPRRAAVSMPDATSGSSADGSTTTVSFGAILFTVRRHLWLLTGMTLAAGVIMVLMVLRDEPVYRATAMVRIADERRSMTSGLEEADRVDDRVINPILSHLQLLRSRMLVGRIVDSLGVRLKPDFEGFKANLLLDVRVDWNAPADTLHLRFLPESVEVRTATRRASAAYGSPVRLAGVQFTVASRPEAKEARWIVRSRERAIDGVLEQLRAKPRQTTNVVDISYVADRPGLAHQVVNAAVYAFRVANAEAAQLQSRRRRIFLEEQLAVTSAQLEEAQQALAAFRSDAQIFSSREKLAAQQKELMALDIRREELSADVRTYQALLERLRSADSTAREAARSTLLASPDIGANPLVARISERIGRHRQARDSLMTGEWRRSANDPDVLRLSQLIASAEREMVDAIGSHVASLEGRLEALRGLRSRSATTIEALPRVEATEARLAQQVETMRRMADKLREDYQKARMAEAVEVGQVEIVDLAAMPYEPVPRLGSLKVGVGVLIGLIAAICLAFLLDHHKGSIRRREEVEDLLRIPNLGVIPQIAGHTRGEPSNGKAGLPNGVEAFRVVRTNLLYAPGASTRKTIVVTSAAPGEGKTITSANLAITFACEGLKVLLVDCDVRRARIHKVFGLPRSPGLCESLEQDAPGDLQVYQTGLNGLFVLPSGRREPNAAETLPGTRMRTLLQGAADHFDLVILDTPPVLAAADASILAALSDQVLLVVRAASTSRTLAREALVRLRSVGANVAGAVLNDPKGALPGYAEYGYG
jgi:succinoglycan biosynthesis transport protein ExoP